MIACSLEKHLESGKMFVTSWWFVPKQFVKQTKEKFPSCVIVDTNSIPEGFYRDPSNFYYESEQLINSRGTIK